MTDYIVALPPEARNIQPNLPTFERAGKDGNEKILPIWSGDRFVGEVLEGGWVKGDDGDILGPHTQLISGGELQLTGKSHSAGDEDFCWVRSKSKALLKDGTVIDVHLKLPSHSAANFFWMGFVLTPNVPSGVPKSENDYLYCAIYTNTTTYTVYVIKNVGGSSTTLLNGEAITNAEGTFRLKFNESGLGYTNVYFHDGSGDVDESEDEVTDSPFSLDLNFDSAICSFMLDTSETTNRTVVSEKVTVTYPFGSNISQLVKFDAPRGTKAGTETLFEEAEDATLGAGVGTSDLDDDSGTSAVLNAQNEYVRYAVTGLLSQGRYLAMFRVKDTAQVASDVQLKVYNSSDASYLNVENAVVLKTAEGTYKVYELLFDVDSEDAGDTLYLEILKATATANTVYVDWFRIVPYNSLNGRVKCFDTMNEGSEDDWLEVFDADHNFVGDCVIENGLIRLWLDTDQDYGYEIYIWQNNSWVNVFEYIQFYFSQAAKYLYRHQLLNIVSLTTEEIIIQSKVRDTAILDEDYYMVFTTTLKRGKYAFSLSFSSIYPFQPFDLWMFGVTKHRFGISSDVEALGTVGVGDEDVSGNCINSLMTDNFVIAFDNDLAGIMGGFYEFEKYNQWGQNGGRAGIRSMTAPITVNVFLLPFSRVMSLFAEAEDEVISAAARLYMDGAGEDTITENDGVWAATTNCAKDENNLAENSVGSACVEITSSGAGAVVATGTPAAPLGKLTKFDDLKLYLHGTPDSGAVTIRLKDADGDSVTKSQAITGSATQYTIALPHSATDLQGWTQVGTYDFTTFTELTIEWTAAGAGELVYVDGLHFYIGTTTARGRGETLSGSSAVVLDAQNEEVYQAIATIQDELPDGRYLVLVRAKDTDQVASDLLFQNYNTSDSSWLNQENANTAETLTSAFKYYQQVIDIESSHYGDAVRIPRVVKNTVTENTIFVDYVLVIPIGNGQSFPQDCAHSSLRKIGSQRRPVDRRETT